MQQAIKREFPELAMARETMLELVEYEGKLVLRPMNSDEEPLLSIEFSDQVKEMLGGDTHFIGQHMIHVAIQGFMHKQVSRWHANVYDEEPTYYS